jgi:hypothetical protein
MLGTTYGRNSVAKLVGLFEGLRGVVELVPLGHFSGSVLLFSTVLLPIRNSKSTSL